MNIITYVFIPATLWIFCGCLVGCSHLFDPTSAERMVQVWSRHSSRAQKPPKTGWNIPWDGPVRTTYQSIPRKTSTRKNKTQQKSTEKFRSLEIQKSPVSSGVSLAVVDFLVEMRVFFWFSVQNMLHFPGCRGLETFVDFWKNYSNYPGNGLLLVEFLFWNLWVGVWCLGFSSFFKKRKKEWIEFPGNTLINHLVVAIRKCKWCSCKLTCGDWTRPPVPRWREKIEMFLEP